MTLRPRAGTPLGKLALAVSRYIHENFEYARDVTLASSPVDDVLEQIRADESRAACDK